MNLLDAIKEMRDGRKIVRKVWAFNDNNYLFLRSDGVICHRKGIPLNARADILEADDFMALDEREVIITFKRLAEVLAMHKCTFTIAIDTTGKYMQAITCSGGRGIERFAENYRIKIADVVVMGYEV